jgi:hypothetical protein
MELTSQETTSIIESAFSTTETLWHPSPTNPKYDRIARAYDTVADFLADKETIHMDYNSVFFVRYGVECADGFWVSIQNSCRHYHDDKSCELGFPSILDPELAPYAEGMEETTDTVFPYTPMDVIETVIAKHGGIKFLTRTRE